MGIELKGVRDAVKAYEKIQRQVEKNLIKSISKSANMLLKESNRLAPKKTGNMIRNSDVKIVDEKEVHVRYNEDYSLYVHENLERRSGSGQAKFLHTATNDNGNKVIKKLSEDLLK